MLCNNTQSFWPFLILIWGGDAGDGKREKNIKYTKNTDNIDLNI